MEGEDKSKIIETMVPYFQLDSNRMPKIASLKFQQLESRFRLIFVLISVESPVREKDRDDSLIY